MNPSWLIDFNACVWKCDANVDKTDISPLNRMKIKKKSVTVTISPLSHKGYFFYLNQTIKVTKVVWCIINLLYITIKFKYLKQDYLWDSWTQDQFLQSLVLHNGNLSCIYILYIYSKISFPIVSLLTNYFSISHYIWHCILPPNNMVWNYLLFVISKKYIKGNI